VFHAQQKVTHCPAIEALEKGTAANHSEEELKSLVQSAATAVDQPTFAVPRGKAELLKALAKLVDKVKELNSEIG
jgi:hypothetical protein